ncbi:MAG: RNA polymerase sigma factor [Clostridia bacterium]|nr:RNA polymerase sigma factor [Clostridia bacterium]
MYDIEDICNKYYKNVYKYLMSLSHNPNIAEELTQETFCRAIKEINKFKGNCEIITWLCIIAKHLYYQYSKKSIYENIDDINDISSVSIEDTYILSQDRLDLYKSLQKISESERNVVYLRLLGLSFKEISEIIGKNETWAKVVFHRGKKDLSRYIKGGQNERDRK